MAEGHGAQARNGMFLPVTRQSKLVEPGWVCCPQRRAVKEQGEILPMSCAEPALRATALQRQSRSPKSWSPLDCPCPALLRWHRHLWHPHPSIPTPAGTSTSQLCLTDVTPSATAWSICSLMPGGPWGSSVCSVMVYLERALIFSI